MTLIAIVAALGVLLCLGTWQVKRLQWKEALLSTIQARLQAEPATLDQIVALKAAGQDIEYRPVRLTGSFRHQNEQFFFATLNGRTGYFVYTPFALEEGGLVFVNRGFVDVDARDPASRPEGQVRGPLTIVGLARDRLSGKPSWAVPDNDPAANIFYWKDLDAMAANAGIEPSVAGLRDVFVDADASANPGGQPVGAVTRIDLPNNHLQYAITWYGLALALLGVCFVAWLKRKT